MPITASLGALAVSKVIPLSYDHWYMQVNSTILTDITFDNDNNFYVMGQTWYILKFMERPFPSVLWEKSYSARLGPNTNGAIKYNSYLDVMNFVGSYHSKEYAFYPYYNTICGGVGTIDKTTGAIATMIEDTGAGAASGNDRRNKVPADCVINPSNGEFYILGIDNYLDQYPPIGRNIVYLRCNAAANSATSIAADDFQYNLGVGVTDYSPRASNVLLAGDYNPIILGTLIDNSATPHKVIIMKMDNTLSGTPPAVWMPIIWQRKLTLTSTLIAGRMCIDSSDNLYITINDTSSHISYIVKYDGTGALQWQRKITNVTLNDIQVDSSGIYAVGYNTSNNMYVVKYDDTGSLIWQRKMTGFTFNAVKFAIYDSNLYIAGSATSNGFVVKLPIDGSIPGTGSYIVGATTLVYSTDSKSETSGNLVDAVATDPPGYPYQVTQASVAKSAATLSIRTPIANL